MNAVSTELEFTSHVSFNIEFSPLFRGGVLAVVVCIYVVVHERAWFSLREKHPHDHCENAYSINKDKVELKIKICSTSSS